MASKTAKLMKDTAQKQRYLDYYKTMNKSIRPMTQARWMKAKPSEVLLHQAGVDKDWNKPLVKLKRRKRMGVKD